MIPGWNQFAVGTSAAGKRIHDAGLAYQAAQAPPRPKVAPVAEATEPEVKRRGRRPRPSLPGRCHEILAEVSQKYGIPVAAIVSPSRMRKLLPARFEAIFRCVSETELTLHAIGRIFGGRDHTTIGAAVIRHARKHKLVPPRGINWVWVDPEKRRQRRLRLEAQRAAA